MSQAYISTTFLESACSLASIAATPACTSFPTGTILEAGSTKPGPPVGGSSIVKE